MWKSNKFLLCCCNSDEVFLSVTSRESFDIKVYPRPYAPVVYRTTVRTRIIENGSRASGISLWIREGNTQ